MCSVDARFIFQPKILDAKILDAKILDAKILDAKILDDRRNVMTSNGLATQEAVKGGVSSNGPATVELYLQIDDGDLCSELAAYPEGQEREEFAISAMKIGVIALRQTQGRIDADRIRQEGERFVDNMRTALETPPEGCHRADRPLPEILLRPGRRAVLGTRQAAD